MKPHHIGWSKGSSIILGTACSLVLLFSCEKERRPETQDGLTQNPTESLKPKDLATIEFDNGVKLEFRTEEDGVLYDMQYSMDIPDFMVVNFKGMSPLKLFLTLSDDHVLVPEDLLIIEKDEELILKAKKRGTIDVLTSSIKAKCKFSELNEEVKEMPEIPFDELILCNGEALMDDLSDPADGYLRLFRNYTATNAGNTTYSSTNEYGNACNRVDLTLQNCTDLTGNDIVVKLYKKVLGVYYLQSTLNIDQGTLRQYSKSYTIDHYQKVNIQTESSHSSENRFGGMVYYWGY